MQSPASARVGSCPAYVIAALVVDLDATLVLPLMQTLATTTSESLLFLSWEDNPEPPSMAQGLSCRTCIDPEAKSRTRRRVKSRLMNRGRIERHP